MAVFVTPPSVNVAVISEVPAFKPFNILMFYFLYFIYLFLLFYSTFATLLSLDVYVAFTFGSDAPDVYVAFVVGVD